MNGAIPGVPEQHQPGQPRPHRTIDRTISATCQTHGATGFCNLRVTKAGEAIEVRLVPRDARLSPVG